MKYGYYIRAVYTYPEIRGLALTAEKHGFDSVHVNDHLIGFDPERKQPYLEAVTLMSAIAAVTQKVQIGHIVLANSYRNPALTAKIISSIDNISNGRALFWVGAGWYKEEYEAYGYPFPSAKRRVDELEESLTIFKKLFTEEVTNYKGQFWNIKNCKNFPKPIQKPWPPIVIGASKNRLTTIACRDADGINLPDSSIHTLKKRIDFITSKLEKYNRNPKKFEISIFNDIILINTDEELDEIINQKIKQSKLQNESLTKEQILKNSFIGYVNDIKDKIREMEEFNVKRMVVQIHGSPSIKDPIKIFHDKIIQ